MDKPCIFRFGLMAILLFFPVLRWPMLNVPMERDEGEYATMGLALSHGIPPYSEAYTMKPPGAAACYALIFRCLGATPRAVHLALLAINSLTIAMVALIGRTLMGWRAGLFAAAAYGTFTIGTGMFGFWLSAEHFAVFFLMVATALLLMGNKGKFSQPTAYSLQLTASFLLGCSSIIKPHAALPAFAILLSTWIIQIYSKAPPPHSAFRIPHLLFMLLAFALPTLLVMALMAGWGVWEKFRFWTWDYAGIYATAVPLRQGWEYFKMGWGNVFFDAPLLWVMAFAGLVCCSLAPSRISWRGPVRLLLVPASLASALAISLGFFFRGQYFILLAPFASLLAGAGWEMGCGFLSSGKGKDFFSLNPSAKSLLCGGLLLTSFIPLYAPLMGMGRKPSDVCRLVYGMNPFPESPVIADHLKQITSPWDKIAILGSEPQIYFLADRRPGIPYLYMYEAMKTHGLALSMQKEIIQCLEKSNPKALVFVQAPTSWGSTPSSDPTLLQWLKRFIPQYYHLAGMVDLVSETKTVYHWGNSAQTCHPESPFYLLIFLRKD